MLFYAFSQYFSAFSNSALFHFVFYLYKVSGKKKKILFVEKPFAEKCMSMREKNEKFAKRSLMVTLVKQNPARFTRGKVDAKKVGIEAETPKPAPVAVTTSRELQKLNVDYNLIGDMDSFGCSGNATEAASSSLSIFNRKASSDATNDSKVKEEVVEDMAQDLDGNKSSSSLYDHHMETSSGDETSNLVIIDSSICVEKNLPVKDEAKQASTSLLANIDEDELDYSTEDDEPLSSLCKKAKSAKILKNVEENNDEPKSPTMDTQQGICELTPRLGLIF